MKRALVILSSLLLMPLLALADTETVDEIQWTFTISFGEATIGSYPYPYVKTAIPSSTEGSIIIPSRLGGCPVTGIESCAFCWCEGLTSVTIPEGVTWIGASAFEGCTGLKSVTIPSSTTNIYSVPDAFSRCDNLTEIVVNANNPIYSSQEGILYVKKKSQVIYCSRGLTSVTIPSSVTDIGGKAFEGCIKFTSVTIPSGVTNIGNDAFAECAGLTSVTIPSSVISIGASAFFLCSELKRVDIGDLEAWCGISFKIPEGFAWHNSTANPLYYAEHLYLKGKEVKDLVLPDGVKSIGNDVFYGCSGLISVSIPNGVTNVGANAFADCGGLTSVTIPPSVKSIGNAAFLGCDSLKTVVVAKGDVDRVRMLLSSSGCSVDGYDFVEEEGLVPPSYTVTYRPGEYGVGLVAVDEKVNDVDLKLRGALYVREGFVQTGWSLSDGGSLTFALGASYANNASVVLYPYWTEADPGTGAVTIEDVEVFSGYPWKEVVIGYKIKGKTDGPLTLVVQAKDGASGKTYACLSLEGAECTPGSHVMKWNASADGAKFKSERVAFKLHLIKPPLYCVVDLTGGVSAKSYPVTELEDAPIGGWSDEYKTTKLVLRRIEAGSFTMGSSRVNDYNAKHQVTLTKPYYIGVFEVTQKQWELVMGTRPSYFYNETCYASRPVERVSYDMIRGSSQGKGWPTNSDVDADSFFGKLRSKTGIAFDLPTEAQWEYACRAGTTTDYNNRTDNANEGEDANLDNIGRYRFNGGISSGRSDCTTSAGTAKVGFYEPNDWGLFDMHGNVWEWCLDWDGGDLAAIDPLGAASGLLRIMRGGSWDQFAEHCTSSYRFNRQPSSDNENNGFRVCIPVQFGECEALGLAEPEVLAGALSGRVAVDTTFVDGTLAFEPISVAYGTVCGLDCQVLTNGAKLVSGTMTGSVEWKNYIAGTNELVYVGGALMKSLLNAPRLVECDDGAIVIGDPQSGLVIRPSAENADVIVAIPQGVVAAKVTVEVSPNVKSVKPNGAMVKVVSGSADITQFLDIPGTELNEAGGVVSAQNDAVIDLTKAAVKGEVVREVLDPAKGAVVKLDPTNPVLATANTRIGLIYTFREGRTLAGMKKSGDGHVGDGDPWTPEIKVKGGDSAFYSIGVGMTDEPDSEAGETLPYDDALYCVIDLSGGTSATKYPVSVLDDVPSGGWTEEYKTTKLVLRRIEPGSYLIQNQYEIVLTKPFYIGVFEVTQKQYELVMGSNPSSYKGDTRPVECVPYDSIRGTNLGTHWPTDNGVDTQSFLGRLRNKTGLDFDLPTEAEWEYACRAGTTSVYNNGGSSLSDLKQVARCYYNCNDGKGGYSVAHTTVGSYLVNAWGLYDMHGNVWEWCRDWEGSLAAGTDPKGAATSSAGAGRVHRGGCWYGDSNGCTATIRGGGDPSSGDYYKGFRISRTLR